MARRKIKAKKNENAKSHLQWHLRKNYITSRTKQKRSITRFPVKYMFELTEKEHESLRSQFATSKTGRGGTRYLPNPP